MFSTKVLFGKQTFHKGIYSKSDIMSTNMGILTKFGECKISSCKPPLPVLNDFANTKRSRPTHFLALRLNSPALYKNVGKTIVMELINRVGKFNNCLSKKIHTLSEFWSVLRNYT